MKIKFYASLTGLFLVASTLLGLSLFGGTTSALRYCDDNSIIRCGALDANELQQKYNGTADQNVKAIFSHYGITSSMVANADSAKIGTVKKNGEVVVDGKVVATAAQTVGRKNVSGSTPVNINGTTYYQRTPADVFIVDSQQAFVFFDSNGKFVAAILQPCGNPIVATPKEQPKPQPKYTCDNLTVTPVSRTQFTFKADRTVENAEYVRTNFVIRDSEGTEVETIRDTDGSLTYTQTTVGDYTVEAQIVVKVNGTEKIASSEKCKKPFEVKEKPAKPVYECVLIEKIKESRDTYEFKVTTRAEGGAVLKEVTVEFGDGEEQTVTGSENASHTYTEPGDYTVTATATFTVDGKDVSKTNDDCSTELTIDEEPVEECKPGIPVGDDRCEEVLGDKDEEKPAEIIKTGPAAIIGGLLAPGALGLGITSFVRSRRAIHESLLNQR